MRNLLNDICRGSRVQGMSIIFYIIYGVEKKLWQNRRVVFIIYVCDRQQQQKKEMPNYQVSFSYWLEANWLTMERHLNVAAIK